MDGSRELKVTITAEPRAVRYVRHALDDFCRAIRLDEETLADLKVALSEACTNVVRHAYGGRPGPLDVSVTVDDEKVSFTVRDQGRGAKPSGHSTSAAFSGRRRSLGGLGTSIMRALVDEITYELPGRGTQLQLVKYLH